MVLPGRSRLSTARHCPSAASQQRAPGSSQQHFFRACLGRLVCNRYCSNKHTPRRSPRTPALPAAPPHRRRRAYDERTRFDVVWCTLVLGSVDVSQTQRAIARACTLLQGAHVPPSQATIFRICRRFRQTGLTTAQPRCGPMISLTADQIDGLRRWCRKPGGKRRGTRLRRASLVRHAVQAKRLYQDLLPLAETTKA